jgi:pilus assembly protein CpaC
MALCGAPKVGLCATQAARSVPQSGRTQVSLVAGRSTVVATTFSIVRIAVADPAIADVTVVRPREMLIDGRAAGTVSLIVWGAAERQEFEIVVGPAVAPLERLLRAVMPAEDISVTVSDEAIILSGTVSTASAALQAVQVAEASSSRSRVINLLKTLDPGPPRAAATPTRVGIVAGRSMVISTDFDIVRVAVADPAIAAATVVQAREILVDGKAPGTVTLIAWGDIGRHQFEIAVEPAIGPLELQLRGLFPGEDIRVSVADEAIVLGGRVSSIAIAQRAVEIAEASSSASRVINLLQTPEDSSSQQVLLEVRFAEVDRRALTELGSSFIARNRDLAARSTTQQFPAPVIDDEQQAPLVFSDYLNLFFLWRPEGIAAVIRALQSRGYFHSLAEPNLIAYNGQEASFLAGGEFPVPVVQGATGTVTIQWKEFGIRLTFRPTITGEQIRLKVRPEVSSIDFANGITLQGFRVPALSTRRAETDVELKDGQSFAIAGLLNNVAEEVADRIPLLGHIPILGSLFRSQSTRKEQTELLVVITPRLVRPADADQAPPLPVDPKLFIQPPAPAKTTPGKPGGGGK